MPAAAALVFLAVLGAVDTARVEPPRPLRRGRLRFRAGVAVMHLLQPLVRTWGRRRNRGVARRDLKPPRPIPGPLRRAGSTIVLPLAGPRAEIVPDIVATLHQAGLRTVTATPWESIDATVAASLLLQGRLVTSAYPEGCLQVRVIPAPRMAWLTMLAGGLLVTSVLWPPGAAILGALTVADVARGLYRLGPRVRRVLRAATG